MKKAVIDMGTNSTRLAIAEQIGGQFQMTYTEVAETRLGEGMGDERIIRAMPLERNVKTVQQFVAKAKEIVQLHQDNIRFHFYGHLQGDTRQMSLHLYKRA